MSRAANRRNRWSVAGDRSWHSHVEPERPLEPEPIDHGDLRYGLDLNDLNGAASIAIRINGRFAGDPAERFAIAWSGAAEHLYSSTEPVNRRDLVAAGSKALDRALDAEWRCHGVGREFRGTGDRGSAPRFAAYWAPITAGGLDERVVESVALTQIWPILPEGERRALAALAAHGGDGAAAAEALDMNLHAFYAAITRGRTRFKRLWLGGESPPGRRAKTGKALRAQNAHRARRQRANRVAA